jgi:cytochrome c-type biogenesis protein
MILEIYMSKTLDRVSEEQNAGSLAVRLNVIVHALLFVLGFSFIFVVGWGGATTLLGQLFGQYKTVIARVGGVILIVFGLATMDIIRIPWFYMDTRPEFQDRKGPYISSLTMGLFFAAGWSPCVGATLGAILTLGFSQDTAAQAMILSSGYALGLGIPFLLLALGLDRATMWVRRLGKHLRTFQIISGILIIAIGVMLVTNSLNLLATWTLQNNLYLDLSFGNGGVPSYFTAIIAGLLSFLSPCVLPLVPAYLGYLSGHALSTVQKE